MVLPPEQSGHAVRERIHRRLRLIGPGPAQFYRDACRLADDPAALAASTHLIAHLLRDIESAVRDVLVGPPTGNEKKEDRHRREIEQSLATLGIPPDGPVGRAWLRLPGQGNAYGLASRAHRDSLWQPRAPDEEFRVFWQEMEMVLDAILDRFEARYLDSLRLLDEMLLVASPTRAHATRLGTHAPNNPVAMRYFFDRLESDAWLRPLRDEGFFRRPPEPQADEKPGFFLMPSWPAADYLARMAARQPELVFEIVREMPATENVRVHDELVAAALAMPPRLVARLSTKLARWAGGRFPPLRPERFGALVAHLSAGHEIAAALELARALLQVVPGPPHESEAAEKLLGRPEPRARFDFWHYQQILEHHVPALVTAAGGEALNLLCDLLDEALRHSYPNRASEDDEDVSFIWRPHIGDHADNLRHNLRNALTDAVRDAALQMARADAHGVAEVVGILERRRWLVFRRVALHVVAECAHWAPTLVGERLADLQRLDERVRPEYEHLLRRGFAVLAPAERMRVLDWIERGPDLGEYREAWLRRGGREPTDAEICAYVKVWKRDWLACIPELDADWARRRADLDAELGPREPSEGSWHGPTSPKRADELARMSVEEVVVFLRTWEAPAEPWRPSAEGLARELTKVVATAPQAFAAEAGRFEDLNPTYVRALIMGLREAVGGPVAFPWDPVLALCKRIVERPVEIPGRRVAPLEMDPDWSLTRKWIVHLLEAGFGASGQQAIPAEARQTVWRVIERLTAEANPSVAEESQYIDAKMDLGNVALNATRTASLSAVVQYALWVRIENRSAAPEFEGLPEVQRVLEEYLDPHVDPSLAVRFVYGWNLGTLFMLAPRWLAAHLAKIFPTNDEQRDLRDAAWTAYLAHWATYDRLFELLSTEYNRAVDQIGTSPERHYLANPDERLAEHLIILFCRGKIDLDDPDRVLAHFLARASDVLRAHAVAHVGRLLKQSHEPLAPAVVERLQRYWLHRLTACASGDRSHFKREIAAFGWWFLSGQFDDRWAVARLAEGIAHAGVPEPDSMVVERLAALAPEMPAEAVACLGRMIEADDTGWNVSTWRDEIRSILAAAIRSGDARTRSGAADLVNRLAARGHLEFRDLLPATSAA